MQKLGTTTFFHKALMSSVLGVGLILCSVLWTPDTYAASDLFDFAEKVLSEVEKSQSGVKNDLIDSSRSRPRRERKEPPRAEIRVSLDQAVSQIRRKTGGKVIKASTSWINGRPVHNIRVLSKDNRMRTYRVDAVTGRGL